MYEAVESCDRVADVTQNEGERVLVSRAEGTVWKLRGDGDEAAAVGRDRANHAPGQGGRARAGESSGHEGRGFHQHALMAVRQLPAPTQFPRGSRRNIGCPPCRSEEHTSELQSLMRISYAVFCLKKKKKFTNNTNRV